MVGFGEAVDEEAAAVEGRRTKESEGFEGGRDEVPGAGLWERGEWAEYRATAGELGSRASLADSESEDGGDGEGKEAVKTPKGSSLCHHRRRTPTAQEGTNH